MNNQPFDMEQYGKWIASLNFRRQIGPWRDCGFSWAQMLHSNSRPFNGGCERGRTGTLGGLPAPEILREGVERQIQFTASRLRAMSSARATGNGEANG
jgi:hypothetical protein